MTPEEARRSHGLCRASDGIHTYHTFGGGVNRCVDCPATATDRQVYDYYMALEPPAPDCGRHGDAFAVVHRPAPPADPPADHVGQQEDNDEAHRR